MSTASLMASSATVDQAHCETFLASPLLPRVLGLAPIMERYKLLPSAAAPAEFARHALEALAIRICT